MELPNPRLSGFLRLFCHVLDTYCLMSPLPLTLNFNLNLYLSFNLNYLLSSIPFARVLPSFTALLRSAR